MLKFPFLLEVHKKSAWAACRCRFLVEIGIRDKSTISKTEFDVKYIDFIMRFIYGLIFKP